MHPLQNYGHNCLQTLIDDLLDVLASLLIVEMHLKKLNRIIHNIDWTLFCSEVGDI